MGEEIAFESGRISDFQGLVTLTLTFFVNPVQRAVTLVKATATVVSILTAVFHANMLGFLSAFLEQKLWG